MGRDSSADLPNTGSRDISRGDAGEPRSAVGGSVPENGCPLAHQYRLADRATERRSCAQSGALERQEEPESLRILREHTGVRLPPVDLPEVILEVAQQTGFLSRFTHISD